MATTKPAAARKAPAKRAKPGPKPKAAAANGAAKPADMDGTPVHAAAPAPAQQPRAFPTHGGTFQFSNGENVTISASGEEGIVRARCEWLTGNVSYYVAYTSARGEFHESWIDQDLLTGEL